MTQILLKGALTLDSKINTTRAQQRERERERMLKKAIEGELRGLKIRIFLDKNPGRHLQEGRDSNAYYTYFIKGFKINTTRSQQRVSLRSSRRRLLRELRGLKISSLLDKTLVIIFKSHLNRTRPQPISNSKHDLLQL